MQEYRPQLARAPDSNSSFERVPSFQRFVRNVPHHNAEYLPRGPEVANAVPRRSSSVYSRATTLWDTTSPAQEARSLVRRHDSLTDLQNARSKTLAKNGDGVSPLTPERHETIPALLQPTTHRPIVVPLQSSSSLLDQQIPGTNIKTVNVRQRGQEIRTGRLPEPVQLSPSPPPMTPMVRPHGSRFSAHLYNTSKASQGVHHHQRAQSDDSPIVVSRLTRPFENHIQLRTNVMEEAFAHMRLGSNVTAQLHRPSEYAVDDDDEDQASTGDEEFDQVETDSESLTSRDILSDDYHRALLDEYKSLASPSSSSTRAQTPESTTNGQDIRLVPAPLFWTQRQREMYPNRVGYAEQRSESRPSQGTVSGSGGRGKKRLSIPIGPIQMMLPNQSKRQSNELAVKDEDSPTTVSLKRALALRLRHKRPVRASKASPSNGPINMTKGSLPLRLPGRTSQEADRMESRKKKSSLRANMPLKPQVLQVAPRESRPMPKIQIFQTKDVPPSAFSPTEDTKPAMRHTLFDKALEVKRERDRKKRRKHLKSQIKFVGQVDPSKAAEDSENVNKKSGGGWI